jgi:8-oxo-(d)GTP phosphatase
VPRSKWKGDDGERPLDSSGRAEAKLLAPLLAAFAPRAQVISSAAARCLDSVAPYAELTGAQVRAEEALQVRSSGTDPAASAALIAETIGAGKPAVVCAHRENVPLLQAAAIGALGPPDGTFLVKEWADELPTAGFWVLHLTPPSAPPPPESAPPPRWWRRRRVGAGATTAGSGCGALVAADRYDLSDA